MSSLTPRLDKLDKNYIINGNFDYWQRGVSSSVNNTYLADRMKCAIGAGTFTVSRSTDVPDTKSTYSLQIAGVSSSYPEIVQRVESTFAKTLAGKEITLKIKVKVVDSTGQSVRGALRIPTVTDNYAGFADLGFVLSATPTVGQWVTYIFHTTLSADAVRGFSITIFRGEGAVATTTTLYSQMQVIEGTHADPEFSYAAKNIIEELQLCKRYYESIEMMSDTLFAQYSNVGTTNRFYSNAQFFEVEKRAIPTTALFHLGGPFYWTIIASAAFSANDITGATIQPNTRTWFLYQTRVAGGSAPASGGIYALEAIIQVTADAEL